MRERTYLDWNATAPLRAEARSAMLAAADLLGNPSSPHAEGRRAHALIESAREDVAALVGARPAEVIFTSGGTEANNAVLAAPWDRVALAGIEHASVNAAARAGLGTGAQRIASIPVGRSGAIDVAVIEAVLGATRAEAGLLTLQLANNETGVLQPVAAAAAVARAHGFAVHTDAVQAAGRIGIDVDALGVDYLTLSAHKLGGPTGVGALIVREGRHLPALLVGGGQERRRRAGTENVAGIAGFGAAARAATAEVAAFGRVAALRDRLEAQALALAPEALVIGCREKRVGNTTSLALPGRRAETLVIAFDLAGVAVSAGAACSSGKVGTSGVLEAMGIAEEVARAAIRVSLGWTSAQRDVNRFLTVWADLARNQSATRARRAVACST
jgi:cysteine desulfurase